jgi:hypothetical protein
MRVILPLLFVLLASEAARAEETPTPQAGDAGRFAMAPAEGGFLRLDKETGAVSFCSAEGGLAVCRLAAEERAALEAEVARLSRENADLRAKLPGAAEAEASKKLWPGEEELDRALAFTEKFFRRMMKAFREEAPQGERL